MTTQTRNKCRVKSDNEMTEIRDRNVGMKCVIIIRVYNYNNYNM